MTKRILVVGVNKTFGQNGESHEVLRNIHFQVEHGEFVCIVGASGGGKSTLLKIMCGLEKATSGSIQNMPTRIGFVFQNFALFPWLTVEQNIGFGLQMNGAKPATIRRAVHEQIAKMGLEGFEKVHPKELSGGMKQRVGIARALAVEPDVLILDEPFSSLDEITAQSLRKDLLKIWQNDQPAKSIIMVTHLIEEAVELADKIIVMGHDPGQIKRTLHSNLARPRNLRTKEAYTLIDEITGLI